MISKFYKNSRGVTLFEAVVYIALLAVLVVFMFNSLLSVNGASSRSRAAREISDSAVTALDRISRTTRDAIDVDDDESTFNDDDGKLVVNVGLDVFEFYIDSDDYLVVKKNVEAAQPLVTSDIKVNRFNVRKINTTNSEAVKIVLELEYTNSRSVSAKTFYNTIVLRGSY